MGTIKDIRIFPEGLAAMNVASAGRKYRPSNGTEGECFMSAWCAHCARDKAMREGADLDDCDDNQVCNIIGLTMSRNIEDPKYPTEWQYGPDGQPRCAAFVPAGQPIPAIDEHTIDMFNDGIGKVVP